MSVRVDDRVWRQLKRKFGKELAKKHVRVGVLASEGGRENHDGITMVELAAIHEFGSPAAGIPQRSFIRETFEQASTRDAQKKLLDKLAGAMLKNKIEPDAALALLGTWAVNEIKQRIRSGIPPKNAASTIAKKGSSTPLVDTGRLINAVTHKVEG